VPSGQRAAGREAIGRRCVGGQAEPGGAAGRGGGIERGRRRAGESQQVHLHAAGSPSLRFARVPRQIRAGGLAAGLAWPACWIAHRGVRAGGLHVWLADAVASAEMLR